MRLFLRGKGLLFTLLTILLLVAFGCSNGGGGGSDTYYKTTLRSTLSVDADGGVTEDTESDDVIFEVTTVRDTGEPETVTFTFDTYSTPAEIEIYNGGDEEPHGDRVSSAEIVLNGVLIFGPDSFNQNVEELEADIELLDGENVLEVTLRSKPGAKVTIMIEQEIEDDEENDDDESDGDPVEEE